MAVAGMTVLPLDGGGFRIYNADGSSSADVKKLSLAVLRQVARSWGLSITKSDDEYRINKTGGREATAAYTNDALDAINTGISMARKGAW